MPELRRCLSPSPRVHQRKVHRGERGRRPASSTCLDRRCWGRRGMEESIQGRRQPRNTSGVHLKLVFKEQTRYMKGGSYMGLQRWGKAARWNRHRCRRLVLTASHLEVTFASHTFSEGDFALCERGMWDCVVLVPLIFAIFALRSFLRFPLENGGLVWSANPVAVNFQLPPISGPRCARAVIPLV